ncbi:MAG: GAF domain-containing protein [Planctomycetota bacterium]|nr:MAG: GAF domain-containing protein [Planctomycetota bacterium]
MDKDPQKPAPEDGYLELDRTPSSRFIISSGAERGALEHPYEPGDILANRYVVQGEVGAGGMCTVYLASDRNRNELPVALKIVAGETNEVRLETFRNEFNILAHLDHENLIRVFDFGMLPEVAGFYYTAEYIEGRSRLKFTDALDEDVISDYIAQVCRALEYVHSRGYIHYDIKPQNLLVTGDGIVKLMDFGLSALAGRALGKRIRGTPTYTAPEIISLAPVDSRADLYSLGVTLYELTTGTPPFRKNDLHQLFQAHVTEPPAPPRSIQPEIPEYLEAIILRLLAKNPVDRYDSANAVMETLAKARGVEIELQPAGSTERYFRLPPLCGRDRELNEVRRAIDRLGEKTGQTGGHILIEGPAGIGCTRLLQEIRFEAQLKECATALGSGADPELFDNLGRELAPLSTAEAPPAQSPDDEPESDAAGPILPETIARIVSLANETPVVICIDDTQATSPAARAALEQLARMLTTADAPPLLLITAWLDTEGEDPVAVEKTTRLRPNPLGPEEVGEIATRMFGRVPAPELFVSRLAEATGGIPHAVVEMLRMLVASDEIAVIEGKWRFRGGAEPFPIAPSLSGFYANQIKTLRRFPHNLAFNLALLGRQVGMSEISAIHDETAEQIAATLGDLEQRGIINREEGRVAIASQGIRHALLESRAPITHKRWHKRIAVGLARLRGRGTSGLELAKHFLLAGNTRKGLQYGLSGIEAGEVAKDRATAIPILEQLRAASKSATRSSRTQILFALAEALSTESDPETLIEIIEEYLGTATQKEPAERRILMQRHAARCYTSLNRHEEADRVWRRAIELTEPGSSEYLSTIAHYSSEVLEKYGKFAKAEQLLQSALEHYGDRKNYGLVTIYIALIRIALRRNQRELVFTYAKPALELAREIGEAERPNLINLLGVHHLFARELDEAEKYLTRARQLAAEQRDFKVLTIINGNLMSLYFDMNKVDEALQIAAENETILRRYADFMRLASHYTILGREMWPHMGADTAISYLLKALEYARIARADAMEYSELIDLADISCESGDLAAAARYSEEAAALAERKGIEPSCMPLLIRATSSALTGNITGAAESAAKGLELAMKGNDAETIMLARHRIFQIALLAGDFGRAREELDHLKAAAPAANAERRFEAGMAMAMFWYRTGQIGRTAEMHDRISSDPEITKSNLRRGSLLILEGMVAVARSRFSGAETSFRRSGHLHSADRDAKAFLELRLAEVELELKKRNAETAGTKLERLDEAVDGLASPSLYYRLHARHLHSRLALLEGDREKAYREAMGGILESRGAGYRLLYLDFLKMAAETSRDIDETENLRENAEKLAAELTEPLEQSIRKTALEHLLRPSQESSPLPVTESPGDSDAGVTEELLQLSIFLARENNPRRAIETMLDAAFRVLDAKRAFLVVREKDGLAFSGHRYASGLSPETPDREVSTSIIEQVIESGAPVFSEHAREETVFAQFQSVVDLDLLSILAVPVRVGGEVQGCFYLDNASIAGAFTHADRRLAEYLASLAGAVLDRQLLMRETGETGETTQPAQNRLGQQSPEIEIVRREPGAERLEHEKEASLGTIIGQDQSIRELINTIRRAAATDLPVLLTGESGTGKDLVAKVLHDISPRGNDKFVTVICGGIPETLFESELFGVVRGAFTGADEDRPGLLEIAEDGTLFFDELGDLSLSAQNALLRAVSEGTIRRIGGREPVRINVRIISATNRNYQKLVNEGLFRRDLIFRLNAIEINIAPLRERRGDIPLLAAHFLKEITASHGSKPKPLSLAAMEQLEAYSWPGNVRELRNVLERAMMVSEHSITPVDLKLVVISDKKDADREPKTIKLDDVEREHILRVLELNNGKIGKTAEKLGITRHTLRYKLAKYRNSEG